VHISLSALAADLRDGRLTPTSHIEQTLARIDALGDTSWANLVVCRDDARALAEARQATEEIRSGRWRGPLHGVAVAVKDNIDVRGMPTRAGSGGYRAAEPASQDAEVVGRLRQAGAIVVGKAHMHELAYGPTGAVSVDGPACNPHDPSRITGGSSSGSAALVALGVVPLALGTDTGCSVRTPAALCGVTGLMPALGLLPTHGVVPLSTTFDHVGLLASDAESLLIAWQIVHPASAETPDQGAASNYRVGILRGDSVRVHEPEVAAAVQQAAAALQDQGCEVVPVELPELAELAATYPVIVGSEAYSLHRAVVTDRAGELQPLTRQRLGGQAGRLAVDYLSALTTMRVLRDQLLNRVRDSLDLDVLLLATTPVRAPALGDTHVADEEVAQAMLRLCIPFSVLGTPAVSTPAPDIVGLPIGLQLVGVRVDEAELLRLADRVSTATDAPR
jgi:aspartyl-tRNA(Asn)/glutamyl-tRNA(Gln) amidotransferase subunit A